MYYYNLAEAYIYELDRNLMTLLVYKAHHLPCEQLPVPQFLRGDAHIIEMMWAGFTRPYCLFKLSS